MGIVQRLHAAFNTAPEPGSDAASRAGSGSTAAVRHTTKLGAARLAAWALSCALGLGLVWPATARAEPPAPSARQAMQFRYWDWGATPKRDDYQFALLKLALDKTVADYGPYELHRVLRSYSTSRLRREINRGTVVNVHAGPWRPMEVSADKLAERSLRVQVPVLKDLLGYRKLLIRRDDLDRFMAIRSADELKRLVVGQASGWVDVQIYQHNGYRVNDSANPSTLFDMLAKKRFDYIPISVMDVRTVLDNRPGLDDELMLLPDITLYFPLPIIFYVNKHEPLLAERLEAGLKLARQDGAFEHLFKTSFAQELQLIRAPASRRFVLSNPFVPPELAQERSLDPAEPAATPSSPARPRHR